MRRIGGLAERTCSRENVELALKEACRNRNKKNSLAKGMMEFLSDRENNIRKVMEILRTGNWEIHGYRTFHRTEHGKRRKIDWNPSFRDNVIQHALFQTIGKALNETLIPDTFSGIEGRGTHHGMTRVRDRILSKYPSGTPLYVMKVDIRHYYESVDTGILKSMLQRKIKDSVILKLLFSLVDSHPEGLPIGNYLSQLLANFYLNEIDHWAVEQGVDYFRYCDDIVALSNDKQVLKSFMMGFEVRLNEIGLSLKDNKQIFPIERTTGIDFMGFCISRGGVRLRKRIERNLRRSVHGFIENPCRHTFQSLESYHGWTKWLTRGESLWNAILGEQEAA